VVQIVKDSTTLLLATRLRIGAIGILMCFAFAGLMYALWYAVGDPLIENFQGRYFIPIFPLFFLALPYKVGLNHCFFSQKIFYGLLIATYIYTIFQVLERYYV
jgi:uncharacterized membrane protein